MVSGRYTQKVVVFRHRVLVEDRPGYLTRTPVQRVGRIADVELVNSSLYCRWLVRTGFSIRLQLSFIEPFGCSDVQVVFG